MTADGGKLQPRRTQATTVTVSAPGFRNILGDQLCSLSRSHRGRTAFWSPDGLGASRQRCTNIHFTWSASNAVISAPQRARAAGFSSASGSPLNKLGSPAGPTETVSHTRSCLCPEAALGERERGDGAGPGCAGSQCLLPVSRPRAAGGSMGKGSSLVFPARCAIRPPCQQWRGRDLVTRDSDVLQREATAFVVSDDPLHL